MNTNKINSEFIEEIKKIIADTSIIESLEEVLPLGKEAIYRRLRGNVTLSFPEAVLIAKKLNISLDGMYMKDSDEFCFKVKKPSKIFSDKAYADYLTFGIEDVSDYVQEGSRLFIAGAGLPVFFTQNYNHLLKFRYFKWLHENRDLEVNRNKLSQTSVPKNLIELAVVFLSQLRQVDTTFMLSDTMFENYMKEIKHFIYLGLIQQDDIDLLKEDLHNLINEFETVVASGRYKNGAEVSVYLTDINLDSTFGYLNKGKIDLVFSKMFGMNYGTCSNSGIYSMFKAAFEDLKDYATLISQSGSARRTSFFKEQHTLVDEVLILN